jgi:hypothetical protein
MTYPRKGHSPWGCKPTVPTNDSASSRWMDSHPGTVGYESVPGHPGTFLGITRPQTRRTYAGAARRGETGLTVIDRMKARHLPDIEVCERWAEALQAA